jgi:hypothetical protein
MRTARDHFARSVELARTHALTGQLLANLPMLGLTRALAGEIALGRAETEEARLAAHKSGELRSEIVAGVTRAIIDEYRADYPAMLEAGEQSLELARQLGSVRFEAEAQAMCGIARCNVGDEELGLELLRASAELCEDPAVASYCGVTVLGALGAAAQQPDERRAAFERAERLLERSIGANRYEFYRYAIEASVAERDEQKTLHLCQELETLTRAEPLPWSDLLIASGRAALGPAGARAELVEAALRSDFRWLCLKLLNNPSRNA